MKKDFFIHARHKFEYDDRREQYIHQGITCKSLSDIEKAVNKEKKEKKEKEKYVIGVKGGVTLAIFRLGINKLVWSISKCTDYDTYSKRIGRVIASNRIKKHLKNLEDHDVSCLAIVTPDIEFEDAIAIGKKVLNQVDEHGYEYFLDLTSERLLLLK